MNNWSLKNIPKIAHLYWGRNVPLSYLRFLTVKSFSRLNPDWQINVYYPSKPVNQLQWETREHKEFSYEGKDYFNDLKDYANIIEVKIDNDLSEVQRSDLFRWELLYKYGGLWSDFDIYYIKPISDLLINIPFYEFIETILCYNYGFHSIGFLMSNANNQFFYTIYRKSLDIIKNKPIGYQIIGSPLLKNYIKIEYPIVTTFKGNYIISIPYNVIYPYRWSEAKYIFKVDKTIENNTIGIHWFAGHPTSSQFETIITEQNVNNLNKGICVAINEI